MDIERGGLEDSLRAVEHERLAAFISRDEAVARSLHAPDYELITPGGRRISGEEYITGVFSGQFDYRVFEPDGEIRVRVHETVAILRYVARIEMRLADGVDAGRFWHTDVYELRHGRWQAVWSQATRIPGG